MAHKPTTGEAVILEVRLFHDLLGDLVSARFHIFRSGRVQRMRLKLGFYPILQSYMARAHSSVEHRSLLKSVVEPTYHPRGRAPWESRTSHGNFC